jgi:hypothetical protein
MPAATIRRKTRGRKVDVNLGTVEAVEQILRKAEEPVSKYYILEELRKKGKSSNDPRVERALGYLYAHSLAVKGSKGIQWTHSDSESLKRAAATGREL